MQLTIAFIESEVFTEVVEHYFQTDESYRLFQLYLMDNPHAGAVIKGAGSMRKIRWADPRRNKGKRGGLRIVYAYFEDLRYIGIFDVYDKDEAVDLTSDQRKQLKRVTESIRASLQAQSNPEK